MKRWGAEIRANAGVVHLGYFDNVSACMCTIPCLAASAVTCSRSALACTLTGIHGLSTPALHELNPVLAPRSFTICFYLAPKILVDQ